MEVELYPEYYQDVATSSKKSESPHKDLGTNLDQSIKRIIENEGFITYTIDKHSISTNGGNYLGMLYEINVKGTTKDGDKELNLFVKNIIDGEIQIVATSDMYKREIFVYKELAKIFVNLQEEANVPLKDRYKFVKIYEESNGETIIMENVTKNGFTTYDRAETVPLDFVEMAVEHLARFHGLSFVIKDKMPEYFETKLKSINHVLIFNEHWQAVVKSLKDSVIKYVDEEFKNKIEKAYDDLPDKFPQYSSDQSIKACLCHGDYRPNNIMTKIKDGKVRELIPVDYQTLYYGCPIFDFLYLIYSCTDRNFRKAHMLNLKNLYYEKLTVFLGYFDLEADLVYPREEFERVYRTRLDQGLMYAMMYLPFVMASEEEIPDLTKDLSKLVVPVNSRFRDRFRGIIEDYVEWGLL